MNTKIALSIGMFLCVSLVHAQLLVIPKVGMYMDQLTPHDDSFIEGEKLYSGIIPEVGAEISMGLTNEWAVGLDYFFSWQKRSMTERMEIIDFDSEEVSFRVHDISARVKYAMMDMFFVNAGLAFSLMENVEHQSTGFSGTSMNESLKSRLFAGPNLGAEIVWYRILIGAGYTYHLGVGNDGSNQLGFAASRHKFEAYVGYLFNLKVLKNDPWEKKCPRF